MRAPDHRSSAARLAARWPLWLALSVVWCAALAAETAPAPAQNTKDAEAPRSTLSGVYTDAQAASGKSIFEMTCLGNCHNAASHKGDVFRKNWNGKTVWELFQVIKDQMPDDNPGVLTPQKSAQIVAYLFKLNAMPAGTTELPTDPDTLKKIKIELSPSH